MTKLSVKLRRLDQALLDLDSENSMLLSEFDGFCAGVLICPDLISPAEWLPCVWGEDEEALPVFDTAEDMRKLIAMLTDHYNDVATTLLRQQGDYAAIFDVDTRHDERLWETWIEGFEAAVRLRPLSWTTMARQLDEDTDAAFSCLVALMEIARQESDLPEATIEALTQSADGLIPGLVETLYGWRLRHQKGPVAAATVIPMPNAKAGRNEPCPCGSGRKYKKCCGLN